jgi:hypothetical protein
VIAQPDDSGAVNTIAALVVVCFLIGVGRAWELISRPSVRDRAPEVMTYREDCARRGRSPRGDGRGTGDAEAGGCAQPWTTG